LINWFSKIKFLFFGLLIENYALDNLIYVTRLQQQFSKIHIHVGVVHHLSDFG